MKGRVGNSKRKFDRLRRRRKSRVDSREKGTLPGNPGVLPRPREETRECRDTQWVVPGVVGETLTGKFTDGGRKLRSSVQVWTD